MQLEVKLSLRTYVTISQPQQKSAPNCDFEVFGAIIMDTYIH